MVSQRAEILNVGISDGEHGSHTHLMFKLPAFLGTASEKEREEKQTEWVHQA